LVEQFKYDFVARSAAERRDYNEATVTACRLKYQDALIDGF